MGEQIELRGQDQRQTYESHAREMMGVRPHQASCEDPSDLIYKGSHILENLKMSWAWWHMPLI